MHNPQAVAEARAASVVGSQLEEPLKIQALGRNAKAKVCIGTPAF
jgi:hypothetical protein